MGQQRSEPPCTGTLAQANGIAGATFVAPDAVRSSSSDGPPRHLPNGGPADVEISARHEVLLLDQFDAAHLTTVALPITPVPGPPTRLLNGRREAVRCGQ